MVSAKDTLMEYLIHMDAEGSKDHRQADGSDNSFHASTFFMCLRKRWYSRQPGVQRNPTDPPLLYRFQGGKNWEEVFAKAFMHKGILIEREVPVRDGEFSGRVDFVINEPATDTLGIVELKTVHPFGYDKIQREGMYRHHKAQVMWYYHNMKKDERWKEVSFMKLVYCSIADSRCTEFTIPYDEFFIQEVQADGAKLMDYYQHGIAPEPLPKNDWQCKKCEFNGVYCHKNGN